MSYEHKLLMLELDSLCGGLHTIFQRRRPQRWPKLADPLSALSSLLHRQPNPDLLLAVLFQQLGVTTVQMSELVHRQVDTIPSPC